MESSRAATVLQQPVRIRNSTIAVTGTGQQYFKLTRTGNTYQAAVSLDGGATYLAASPQTFTAGLPDTVYVGLHHQLSQHHRECVRHVQ